MSENNQPTARKTLGLTGLTVNAMALIAPGAFLWLTFAAQALYGQPMAGIAMWFGILVALLLCFATAISYAELSKLYPGAGSSYYFAEQAFLSKTKAFRFARIAKFVVGWASHLYYWVYPGVMVAVTAILVGYLAGQVMPSVFNSAVPSPLLMILFCLVFPFFVGYIAYSGVNASTAVNLAINVIQITALIVFTVIAIGYRLNHSAEGAHGITLDPNGVPVSYVIATQTTKDDKGNTVTNPVKDKDGNWVFEKNPDGTPKPFTLSWAADQAITQGSDPKNPTPTFQFHKSALSVIAPHGFSFIMVQACVAILILVGFESITSLGEEAKDAKRDIPRAVLMSLVIQGAFCYLFEYFGANFFLNSGYTLTTASGSPAPIGDMMQIVGTWVFGSPQAGWWFMFIQAITVFLALIGTTLACINTGVRVTFAMGRDEEVPAHFGVLHGKNLTPHRAIWVLSALSAIIGIFGVVLISLVIQGAFCYLFEYFGANFFLNSGYTATTASGSPAPIGDMMQIVGTWVFGSAQAGWWFMFIQAITVFLALVGTTLACTNTGVRVTFAMGRDEEVPAHFGVLHGKNLTPHRAIWVLSAISALIGIFGVVLYFCGGAAVTDDTIKGLPQNFWYSFGLFPHDAAAAIPQGLLVITLISNFGTFLLYMMTCILAIIAYREHHAFSGFKHVVVPVFGLLANFGCMLFYLVGPFSVSGMSWKEPYVALAVAAVWGVYGFFYFTMGSKKKEKPVFVQVPA